jgi:chromate reductase
MPLTILGIAGSLRQGSFNRALLRAAVELTPPEAVIETFDLAPIPLYNGDHENDPPSPVRDLKARIRAADAILLATPEYNFSIPGVLKNAIDWGSRPHGDNSWAGKPVAIMGASPGHLGTARCQYHLRQCFLNIDVIAITRPEVMLGSAPTRFDADLNLTDPKSREMVERLLNALIALAIKMR